MIEPDDRLADARLFRGDCLDILPGLDPVDHIITDPPYETHMHLHKAPPTASLHESAPAAERRIRADGHANPPPVDFAAIDGIRGAAAAAMVAACRGWLIVFCTPEGVAPWRDALEAAGARYKRACVWVKPDSAPQFNGQGPAMGAEMFVAAWCGAGHARWNGGGRRNVFTHLCRPPGRTGLHPTEKPVALMAELVRLFSNPGDRIADPFMGVGSTGIACRKLQRSFTGIEINPDYYAAAAERLRGDLLQPDMFLRGAAARPWQDGMVFS